MNRPISNYLYSVVSKYPIFILTARLTAEECRVGPSDR